MERPRQKGHGDYATNVALQLAKGPGTNPRALAELARAPGWRTAEGIAGVEVAGPGVPQHHRRRRGPGPGGGRRRRRRGGVRAHARRWPGQTVNVEFISANPTGPLHLGHTRWAVLGDAIARVLQAAGADGDPGVLHQRPRQPDEPLRRLDRGRRAGASRVPEDGYHGALHRRPGRAGRRRAAPASSTCPRASGGRPFREAGYALQLERAAGPARRLQHPLRRVVLRARRCTSRRLGRRDPAAAQGPRPRLRGRTARCGCAPPTSATTRTGC